MPFDGALFIFKALTFAAGMDTSLLHVKASTDPRAPLRSDPTSSTRHREDVENWALNFTSRLHERTGCELGRLVWSSSPSGAGGPAQDIYYKHTPGGRAGSHADTLGTREVAVPVQDDLRKQARIIGETKGSGLCAPLTFQQRYTLSDPAHFPGFLVSSASPTDRNNNGDTVQLLAAYCGHCELVRTLTLYVQVPSLAGLVTLMPRLTVLPRATV